MSQNKKKRATCGVSRVGARLVQTEQSFNARAKYKCDMATDSNHTLSIVPKPLKQRLAGYRWNRVQISYIKYLVTDCGWLCQTVVIGLLIYQVVDRSRKLHRYLELLSKVWGWTAYSNNCKQNGSYIRGELA